MQILKKTGRLDKSNVYADTVPSVKTYDLDKLVQERKVIKNIGKGGFVYDCFYCGKEYDNSHDYYVCSTNCFIKKYIPNFIREVYPELTVIKDNKITWNEEVLLLLNKTDPMKFNGMVSLLESEMIAHFHGDEKVKELKLNKDNSQWDELVENAIKEINLVDSK